MEWLGLIPVYLFFHYMYTRSQRNRRKIREDLYGPKGVGRQLVEMELKEMEYRKHGRPPRDENPTDNVLPF